MRLLKFFQTRSQIIQIVHHCFYLSNFERLGALSFTLYCSYGIGIVNAIQAALSFLRQLFSTEGPLIYEKCFLFHLKNSFCPQDI